MSGAISLLSLRGVQNWSFVGAGTYSHGAPPTPTYPTVAAGDLLIAVVNLHAVDSVNTPSGWTQVIQQNNADGGVAEFYKIASGSESGTLSLSGSFSASTTSAAIVAFRPSSSPVQGAKNVAISASTTATSLTTTYSNSLYIGVFTSHSDFGSFSLASLSTAINASGTPAQRGLFIGYTVVADPNTAISKTVTWSGIVAQYANSYANTFA